MKFADCSIADVEMTEGTRDPSKVEALLEMTDQTRHRTHASIGAIEFRWERKPRNTIYALQSEIKRVMSKFDRQLYVVFRVPVKLLD